MTVELTHIQSYFNTILQTEKNQLGSKNKVVM